jgi:hypothetical protein
MPDWAKTRVGRRREDGIACSADDNAMAMLLQQVKLGEDGICCLEVEYK